MGKADKMSNSIGKKRGKNLFTRLLVNSLTL